MLVGGAGEDGGPVLGGRAEHGGVVHVLAGHHRVLGVVRLGGCQESLERTRKKQRQTGLQNAGG